MENENDNEQVNEINTTATRGGTTETSNNEVPVSAQEPVSLEQPPKKSKKKLIIVLMLALLLIAGAVSAYFILNKDDEESVVPAASTASEEPMVAQQTKLFMQFGQKIVAYDTETGQSSVITDKVPEESTVIDFYYGSEDEWRYYADDFNKIYFSDESSSPEAVADSTPYVVANAEKKIFAYEEAGSSENSTSKTYLSTNNNEPKLVYESNKNDFDPNANVQNSDPKSFLYVIRDISSSGDELLYQQDPCFECGGIGLRPSSNSFKLNLKTKKTEVINKAGGTAQPSYFNDNDEVILTEDNTTGFDTGNLIYDITAYLYKKDGSRSEIFKLKDDKTLAYSLSKNGDFAITQLKGKNYNNEEANTLPGSLYSLGGGKAETLKADLEKYDYKLGGSAGECIAAGFDNRELKDDDFVYKYSVGVICKDNNGLYTYDSLENVTNSGDSAEEVIYSLL